LFFVNKQQRHHFGNGTQWSTVLWELLTELFVRSYIQQNELLIILSHFKYVHICEDCKSKFVEMHVDASDIYPSALVFYTRHRVNITIYRTVYLHTDMCLQTLTQLSSIVAIFLQFLTITSLSGHLSDFFKSNFLFHIHFSVVICDFLMKSS
jgi:hypothetical protein